MVILLTIGVPATLVTIASVLMRLPKHFKRDVAVAWLQGHAINNTLTHTIKCMAGRLRPNFYALVAAGREGPARKSFPSGHRCVCWHPPPTHTPCLSSPSHVRLSCMCCVLHLLGSSTSAAAMTMLALLALAILRSHAGARRHRTLAFAARYACVALPALFALYVGVTRTQDYFHDYADVLAGLMIGTLAGFSGHKLEGLDEKLMHQYPSSHEDARAGTTRAVVRGCGTSGGTWVARLLLLACTWPLVTANPLVVMVVFRPCARAPRSGSVIQQHLAQQWRRHVDGAGQQRQQHARLTRGRC